MSRLELCADIQSSSSSSSSSCLRGVFTITIFSVTILWLCFVSICLAQVVRNFHHFCKFLQAICSLAVPPSLRNWTLPQQLSLLLHTFSHHLFDLVQAPANKLTLDLLSCAKVWKMWSLDHGFGLWMTTGLSLCILFVSTYMVYIIKIHISISTCKMLLGTVAWGETSRLWLRPRWKVTTSSACSHSIIPQPQRLRRSCHSYFQLGRTKRPT